jgi:PAS domain S-box-containing protein
MSVFESARASGPPPAVQLGSEREARRLKRRSVLIVGTYVVVAALWILFSDRALEWAVTDPDDRLRYSSSKGLAFVFVTAALLYGLIRASFVQILAGYKELEANDLALQAAARDAQLADAERSAALDRAEQEQRFSAAMIDALPGIFYLYDGDGAFLRWNKNFEEVTGCTASEISEMHPLDFFAGQETSTVSDRIAEVFERGEASIEADIVHRSGTGTPYFLTGRRLLFGDRTCLVGVGIDITERTEAERRLVELNETLEQRVDDRTRELHHALVRAEAADQVKSAFLATMSHELRTPLNSIIGFTGILLQGLAGPLEPEQAKQLGMVQSSARHLLELINDVLDLSKIEAGQLEVRTAPFDLREVLERAVAIVRPAADAAGLSLDLTTADPLPPVVGDGRRLQQVLLNLLTNAIKFTEDGGVSLDVEIDRSGGADHPRVLLRVRDTGVGIDPQHWGQLFDPFRQIDSGLDRRHEGTGLGLAISQRLCALMGGSIQVDSTVGVGSEFTVSIPVDGSDPR